MQSARLVSLQEYAEKYTAPYATSPITKGEEIFLDPLPRRFTSFL
jgi:hypothetical protein